MPKCLRCNSTRHNTVNCKSRLPAEYHYYLDQMYEDKMPEFEVMTHLMLKNIAHNFPFTKTTIGDPRFIHKKKATKFTEKLNYYELDESLPTKKMEKQRKKYLDYYGYDPIPLTLSKKRIIMALKERWNLYQKIAKEYEGNIRNLQKCPICLSNNVSFDCWDNLSNKYIKICVQQKSSIVKNVYNGKPPAKCQVCSFVCCWDCCVSWKCSNNSCPQCRTKLPPLIPKLVWSEDINQYINYEASKNHYYHNHDIGWYGSVAYRIGYICFPNEKYNLENI